MPFPLLNELPEPDATDYWYAICPECRPCWLVLQL